MISFKQRKSSPWMMATTKKSFVSFTPPFTQPTQTPQTPRSPPSCRPRVPVRPPKVCRRSLPHEAVETAELRLSFAASISLCHLAFITLSHPAMRHSPSLPIHGILTAKLGQSSTHCRRRVLQSLRNRNSRIQSRSQSANVAQTKRKTRKSQRRRRR